MPVTVTDMTVTVTARQDHLRKASRIFTLKAAFRLYLQAHRAVTSASFKRSDSFKARA